MKRLPDPQYADALRDARLCACAHSDIQQTRHDLRRARVGVMRTTDGGESWKDCSDLVQLAQKPHLKARSSQ